MKNQGRLVMLECIEKYLGAKQNISFVRVSHHCMGINISSNFYKLGLVWPVELLIDLVLPYLKLLLHNNHFR